MGIASALISIFAEDEDRLRLVLKVSWRNEDALLTKDPSLVAGRGSRFCSKPLCISFASATGASQNMWYVS